MCPHCGEPFHRWGHLQSFDAERLRALLATRFGAVELQRHYFGDYRSLNLRGRLGWVLKKGLIWLGVKGGGETYFFSARKS